MNNSSDDFESLVDSVSMDFLEDSPFKEWNEKLKDELKASRYKHSLGVLKTALVLAERYGEDKKECAFAALLHDCAKHNEGKILNYLKERGEDISKYRPSVNLHAELGAIWAKIHYGLEDPRCLRAIESHTLGSNKMTKLDKIIYVADMIEPGRDFGGLEDLRKSVLKDLDRGLLDCFNHSLLYLLKEGKYIEPRSLEARNALLLEIGHKGKNDKD